MCCTNKGETRLHSSEPAGEAGFPWVGWLRCFTFLCLAVLIQAEILCALLWDFNCKCCRLSTTLFLLTVLTHTVFCTMIHWSIYNPLHLLILLILEFADVLVVWELVCSHKRGITFVLSRTQNTVLTYHWLNLLIFQWLFARLIFTLETGVCALWQTGFYFHSLRLC